ncbi:hypothetical protein ABW21_db0203676 [Orbilia brochopaga]|nr:hypothetical protein ABW21_db0203676 [Drechslerella brochopaga]
MLTLIVRPSGFDRASGSGATAGFVGFVVTVVGFCVFVCFTAAVLPTLNAFVSLLALAVAFAAACSFALRSFFHPGFGPGFFRRLPSLHRNFVGVDGAAFAAVSLCFEIVAFFGCGDAEGLSGRAVIRTFGGGISTGRLFFMLSQISSELEYDAGELSGLSASLSMDTGVDTPSSIPVPVIFFMSVCGVNWSWCFTFDTFARFSQSPFMIMSKRPLSCPVAGGSSRLIQTVFPPLKSRMLAQSSRTSRWTPGILRLVPTTIRQSGRALRSAVDTAPMASSSGLCSL